MAQEVQDDYPQKRASASAFANWVFEQANPHYQSTSTGIKADRVERMRLGVVTHTAVELFLRHSWTTKFLGENNRSGWSLWFADNQEKPIHIFKASCLSIGSVTFSCIPDVVLFQERTASFLIIERKTTSNGFAPKDGWPNVEAQLWCYSQIDELVNAHRVYLVSQLWQRVRGGLSLHSYHPSWTRGEEKHETRCSSWFARYGGSRRHDIAG